MCNRWPVFCFFFRWDTNLLYWTGSLRWVNAYYTHRWRLIVDYGKLNVVVVHILTSFLSYVLREKKCVELTHLLSLWLVRQWIHVVSKIESTSHFFFTHSPIYLIMSERESRKEWNESISTIKCVFILGTSQILTIWVNSTQISLSVHVYVAITHHNVRT